MCNILLALPLNDAPNLLVSVIMEHQAYTNKLFETGMIIYLPIMPSLTQPIPLSPLTTIEKPNVAPTILWVPETGNLRAVATRSQTHDP